MAIRVPSSFPITMTDIWSAVNDHTTTSSKSLDLCYTNSISGYFDPAYYVASKTMGRFRNYGPPIDPPTYSWTATANGTPIAADDSTVVTECSSLLFTVTTTNVPDGTVFSLLNASGNNYSGHYTLNGQSGVNYVNVTISNNYAQATVEFIVDRTIESDGFIAFQFRRSDQSSENITRGMTLRDSHPTYSRSICGSWGPVAHSSTISCTIGGDCTKLKLIDTVKLYRYISRTSSFSLLKTWTYAEVDDGSSSTTLYFTEYGNLVALDAISDGNKYLYTMIITDIYGTEHTIASQPVSCRAYIYTRLTYFSVYENGFGNWKQDMSIEIATNITYTKTGSVTAYLYPNGTTGASSSFSVSSPQNYTTLTSTEDDSYSAFDNDTIEFSVAGGMFSADCGEEVSGDFPQGYTEPINY